MQSAYLLLARMAVTVSCTKISQFPPEHMNSNKFLRSVDRATSKFSGPKFQTPKCTRKLVSKIPLFCLCSQVYSVFFTTSCRFPRYNLESIQCQNATLKCNEVLETCKPLTEPDALTKPNFKQNHTF